jgi:hypothetical protein
MNLSPVYPSRITHQVSSRRRCRRRQSGSAVIVVMALLAIILVYVAGNLRTLNNLGRELKLVERQQTRRLQRASQTTNTPPAITVATNAVPGLPAH